MHLFVRENGFVTILRNETQTFIETEDVLRMMEKHVKKDGSVENMFVEYENSNIPICHVCEMRIIAQLAAAYHNATLAQTLSGQKDLHGNSYTLDEWPTLHREDAESEEAYEQIKCEWDEEKNGDRTTFDSTFEVNEDLVPWQMHNKHDHEKHGFYM